MNTTLQNQFISKLKKIQLKVPSHTVAYREITGLPLPNFSVITRCESWIDCATSLCEIFDNIKEFVLSLVPADTCGISKTQQLLLPETIDDLKTEIFCVHS